MRPISVICTLAVLLLGCATGEVKFKKDDFKGVDIATMKLNFSFSFHSEFVREFKNGKVGNTMIYCTFYTGANEKTLKDQAYIKIDDKIEKIAVKNVSEEIITRVDSTTKTETKAEMDDTGFVDFSKAKKTNTTSVSSHRYKEHSGEIVVIKELQGKLVNAENLTFRFYN